MTHGGVRGPPLRLPDIEHVELPEAGHMIAFDQPERLNEVIADFLVRRT